MISTIASHELVVEPAVKRVVGPFIDPGDDRVGPPHVAGALAPPGKRISFSASKACGNYRPFAVNLSPSHS
jgi:hypothetical protein